MKFKTEVCLHQFTKGENTIKVDIFGDVPNKQLDKFLDSFAEFIKKEEGKNE